MPVAFSHDALPLQSLEHHEKKGGFARLPAAQSKKELKPGTAASCSAIDIDKVRLERRLMVSRSVDELLN